MKKFLNPLLLCAAVVLLPGCGGGAKHSCSSCPSVSSTQSKGEALVTLSGKPVLSVEEFEKKLDLIKRQQPEFEQMMVAMPAEQQAQFLMQIAENLAQQRVRCEHVERSGVTQKAEYQEELALIQEAVKAEMLDRHFQQELLKDIKITDEEARKYFMQQRDSSPMLKRPPFVVTMGGVKAQAVKVANEKEAQALATKARSMQNDLSKAAQEIKKTVSELGLVNQMSGQVDAEIRTFLNDAKRFPAIEVVKSADNSFWVVKAQSKEDTKFAEFNDIKEQIKQMLMYERFNDAFKKRMEDLAKEYNMTINKEYLARRAGVSTNAIAAAPKIEEGARQAQMDEMVDDIDIMTAG